MARKTVLISGAGIAGPTLAYWLAAAGLAPTLIDVAPALRKGGYVIDFWGLGFDIAERMGLADRIDRAGYHMRELRIVNGAGRRVAGFGRDTFATLVGSRYVTIARSDLSRLIFETIENRAEIRFGDEVAALQPDPDGVDVRLTHGGERRFDLVIGADGLHSNIRRLAFGPEERFEKPLGYTVAAFEASGYRPYDRDVYVMYSAPGRMLGRFSLHSDRTLFLFVFAAGNEIGAPPRDIETQKALLRAQYGDGAWECAPILAALERSEDLYFDPVSQIRMERWSHGRVGLLGDAAFAVSLLAGQGSALAMTAAYVLAGELAKDDAPPAAFARYEALLRRYIQEKQRAAERFAGAFAPKTRWGLCFRNRVINALAISGLARLGFARGITDRLRLPDYPISAAPPPLSPG